MNLVFNKLQAICMQFSSLCVFANLCHFSFSHSPTGQQQAATYDREPHPPTHQAKQVFPKGVQDNHKIGFKFEFLDSETS